jgi:hypothetical protein
VPALLTVLGVIFAALCQVAANAFLLALVVRRVKRGAQRELTPEAIAASRLPARRAATETDEGGS